MTDVTLDQVLDALDSARQRATYGAVASVLGKSPRMLMRGRTRDQRHSWIVNRNSGKPTGYSDDELHPDLERNAHIIDTPIELVGWLTTPTTVAAA
jgi:hypothetical protein